MKTVRCLSDWSTYKVYFCLLLCWFYLIETRAFSVLSESWSCVAMPPWDGTKRKVWNSSGMNTNGQRVDDCLFTPLLSRFTSAYRSSWVRLPCLIAISFCNLQLFVASQKEDCLVSEAVMTFVCCCCDYVCFMWKFLQPLCDASTSNFCFPCGSAVSHFLSFSFPPPFFVSW